MKSLSLLLFLAGTPSSSAHPAVKLEKAGFQPDSIYSLAVKPGDYPDESVVWLLDEGVYRVESNGRTSRTTRQVVQILTQQGADAYRERMLSWNPEHDKLSVNWMRVVKPSGEVIADHPEQVQDSDMPAAMATPMYTATKVRRMSLSGLEPGTILDFSVTTDSDAPMMPGEFMFPWRVMTSVPVMRSNLVVDLPADLKPRITEKNLNFKRRESTEKGRKIYTWATSNVPKLKVVRFVPDTIVQGMTVTVSPSFSWTSIGDWYAPIARDAYAVTPAVEEKMSKVLAGAKTLDDSITAIHKWVSQDVRYVAIELGRGGYVPRSAETVTRTGFGDCKDKAMLFLAAMKKIGVTGYPVLLNISGNEKKETPSLGQFNHMIAAIKRGNSYEFADMTAGNYPIGKLPRSEQGNLAVLVKEKGGEQISLPETPQSETTDEVQITGALSEDGMFKGSIETQFTGDLDPQMRTIFQMELDSTKRGMLSRVLASQYFQQPEADSLIAFDGKDFRAPAKVRINSVKAKLLTKAGGVSLLTNPIHPMEWAARLADEIEKEKDRKLPYTTRQMIAASTSHIVVRITMPAGWTAMLPESVKADGLPGHYEMTFSQSGNELRIERTLTGHYATVPASSQAEIVAWLKKIGNDDSKVIVLKAPAHSVASLN